MKKPITEKKTGEKYASKAAKAKHEKSEGAKERMKEYGPKKFAVGGVVGAPTSRAMPAQANKAGAVRGQARAAQVRMAKGGMVKGRKGC